MPETNYSGEMLERVNQAIVALGGEAVPSLLPGLLRDPEDCPGARTFASQLPQPVHVLSTHVLLHSELDAQVIAAAWGQPCAEYRCDPRSSAHKDGSGPCWYCSEVFYGVLMTEGMTQFVRGFDHELYPELIAQAVTILSQEVTSSELIFSSGGGECSSPVTVQAMPIVSPFSVQAAGCSA